MPTPIDEMAAQFLAEATTWPPRADHVATWLRTAARAERDACLADLDAERTYERDEDPFDRVATAINSRPLAER